MKKITNGECADLRGTNVIKVENLYSVDNLRKQKVKIYKKTFIKESKEAVKLIDDNLAHVQYGVDELYSKFRELTKGNYKYLSDISKTNVTDYEDRLDRLSIFLSDIYSLKNDLLDDLDKM